MAGDRRRAGLVRPAAVAALARIPQQPGMLELTAIDVGQGDSLLVVLPRGEIMLVDGGGRLVYGRQRKSNLDIGEDVVSPYLWSRGIRRIDVMVATHAHQDHIGGLAAVMSNFRPKELVDGSESARGIARAGPPPGHSRRPKSTPPDRSNSPGRRSKSWRPPDDYAAEKPGNNDSLVLRISYGSRSFLLTGDMERGHRGQAPGLGRRSARRRPQGRPPRFADLQHPGLPRCRLALGRPDLGGI